MLDGLKERLLKPRQVTVRDAADFFEQQRSHEIEAARDEAEKILPGVEDQLDDLTSRLTELKDYKDPDGHTAVEDVAQNFYRTRKRMIDHFDTTDDLEELHSRLATFIDEFQMMKQKENAVMERIGEPTNSIFQQLKTLRRENQRLRDFLDGDYLPVKRKERLEELLGEIRELEGQIKDREERLGSLAEEDIRDEKAKIEQRLDEHRKKDAWDEKESITQDIEAKREEQDSIQHSIDVAVSKLERGLKKLVYEAENGEISIEGEQLETLKRLQDGEVGDADTVTGALTSARERIREQDILEENEASRFLKASQTLLDLEAKRDRMEDIKSEISSLKDDRDSFSLAEKEQEIRDQIEEKKRELEDIEQERDRIKAAIREDRQKIEERTEAIHDLLNDAFARKIEVVDQEDG